MGNIKINSVHQARGGVGEKRGEKNYLDGGGKIYFGEKKIFFIKFIQQYLNISIKIQFLWWWLLLLVWQI